MPAPQAVVKMVRNGGTRSPLTTKRQLDYLSQNGTVAIEYPESYGGPEETLRPAQFRAMADEWALRSGKYEPGQAVDDDSPALTSHMVVSFPPGTNAEQAKRVGRNFAVRMFDDPSQRSNFPAFVRDEHRFAYFTAFHTDRDHPHLHIVINRRSTEGGWLKIANREGTRSDPAIGDKFTFADLRHELVEAAIEEGMDLEATTRAERGLEPPPMNDVEYRRFMEGQHPRWRQAAAGGDDFIRVENELDEDGNIRGEPDDLDRGHTPERDWPAAEAGGPVVGAAAGAVAAGGAPVVHPAGNPAANPADMGGADGAAGQRRRSPSQGEHDEAIAHQQAEADLFAVERDDEDVVMHDGEGHAPEADRPGTPDRRGDGLDEGQAPAAAERQQRSRRGRAHEEAPNVATRGMAASAGRIEAALLRWQQAEAAAANGAATRAQRRAVEEARKAWEEAEQEARAARSNPGRKRKHEGPEDGAERRVRNRPADDRAPARRAQDDHAQPERVQDGSGAARPQDRDRGR